MKTIVFFGTPDKSHLLLILGRLLTDAAQKVLFVHSTTRHTMHAFLPETEHRWSTSITEYAGMDVAIGFMARAQLDYYREGDSPDYDVLLLDTDHSQFMNRKDLADAEVRVLCSSLDRRELLGNRDLLQQLGLEESQNQPLTFYQLLLPFVSTTLPRAYLNTFYTVYPVKWLEPSFQIPLVEQDLSASLDNQHHGRIHVRHLSRSYVEAVWAMASTWFGLDRRTIRTAWKQMRRRDRRGL